MITTALNTNTYFHFIEGQFPPVKGFWSLYCMAKTIFWRLSIKSAIRSASETDSLPIKTVRSRSISSRARATGRRKRSQLASGTKGEIRRYAQALLAEGNAAFDH